MPLNGTPHGRALAEQEVQIVTEDRSTRMFAPVTSRGEAVGVLELTLDAAPDERTIASTLSYPIGAPLSLASGNPSENSSNRSPRPSRTRVAV